MVGRFGLLNPRPNSKQLGQWFYFSIAREPLRPFAAPIGEEYF